MIISYLQYQHEWNLFVQGKCEAVVINFTNAPTAPEFLFARPSGTKQKDAKAPPANKKFKTKATRTTTKKAPV